MEALAHAAGWFRFVLLAVAPGYAVAFALFPDGARRPGFHGLALALGPPLLGTTTSIALFAGCPAPAASFSVVVAATIFGLIGLGRRRRARVGAEEALDPTGFAVAGAVALVCAAYPFAFEWWRISSDAWAHEGVVRAILREGLPPGDPWYAGLTLRYAWVYHVAAAALDGAGGPDVFAVMAGFSVLAAAATVLAAAAVAALWNPGAQGWTLALLILGLNALFPLFLPLQAIRAVSGEVRGLAALRDVFDLQPFGWDRVGAFLRGFGGQDFFLNKFLVATPLAPALACFAAWLATMTGALREARLSMARAAAAFLLVACGGLMHPVVGLDLAALVGVLGVASFVLFRGDGRRRLVGMLLASGLGILPVAWFVLTFVRTGEGGHGGLPFDLAPFKLLGLGTCLALGLGVAGRGLVRDLTGGDEARLRALVVFAALAVALAIRLPGPSPFFTVDKFSYLVWIPLALAAGGAFAQFLRARRPAVRVLLVVLLFAPVNGLALLARLADPGVTIRQPWQRADFRWMRAELPADAVLLVPPRDIDIGVFAQRGQYYGIDSDAQLRGYAPEDLAARRGLIERVFSKGVLSVEDARRLADLGRPVYAVWTDHAADFWRRTPGAWSDPAEGPPPPGWERLGRIVHVGVDLQILEIVPPRGNE